MKRKGLLLAFFGADGSGKTTIVEALANRLEAQGARIRRFHWRPGILPYRWRINSKKDFTRPHEHNLRGGIKGVLILFYIWLDFFLGYFLVIGLERRKGTIILYERYIYDLVIDQTRYGLKVPLWLRKICVALIPSPQQIINLDASADVLAARKAELPLPEIERQRTMLKQCLAKRNGYILINVEQSNAAEVVRIILDRFHS